MNSLNLLQKIVWSNRHSKNNSMKYETETIKSSLCDYSHAFILFIYFFFLTGDLAVNAGNDTDVWSKNCALFSTCQHGK